ncbi:hypothetical protein HMPREF9440_01944 [Sutterella parvirubra YIT 11816]|uniref:Uncharacterized protein n=1 Tax=Sutterella parvirubra YIT 11816 TaxID=762967 RepID=H3KGR2_9BURK|nr:hypothetical protein HMPREF9440_01944 [Sutterella parvirubra YIT 11816]
MGIRSPVGRIGKPVFRVVDVTLLLFRSGGLSEKYLVEAKIEKKNSRKRVDWGANSKNFVLTFSLFLYGVRWE